MIFRRARICFVLFFLFFKKSHTRSDIPFRGSEISDYCSSKEGPRDHHRESVPAATPPLFFLFTKQQQQYIPWCDTFRIKLVLAGNGICDCPGRISFSLLSTSACYRVKRTNSSAWLRDVTHPLAAVGGGGGLHHRKMIRMDLADRDRLLFYFLFYPRLVFIISPGSRNWAREKANWWPAGVTVEFLFPIHIKWGRHFFSFFPSYFRRTYHI